MSIEIWGVEVYFIAIILSIFANIVIGMFWYSPIAFGKMWQKLVNKNDSELTMKPTDMVLSFMNAFLMTVGLNSVIQFSLQVSNLNEILNIFVTSAMITSTFILPALMNEVIWEGRSFKLFLINISHQFATYLVMSAILSIWI